MGILICVVLIDVRVKLDPCAAVTCLQTQLTLTSLPEKACPHFLVWFNYVAQKVSALYTTELLKARFLQDDGGTLKSRIRTILSV